MEMGMPKITESEIEQFTIELLEKQGYQYIYAPDIAPVILTDLQMDIPGIMENLGKIEVKNG